MFHRAERKRAYLKLAIMGVSGAGKTYSALQLATGLGGKIAMIDTENGSGELYSDKFSYDVASLSAPFTPERYIEYIREAEAAGYNVLIIDSLSPAWNGEGGVLEMVDKVTSAQKGGNSFNAWRNITPMQNTMIQAILQCKMDVIVCLRSKQAYEIVETDKGKKVPVKIGLAPIQRDGVEYEFSIVFDVSADRHLATATKDRSGLFYSFCDMITPEVGKKIREWSDGGVSADNFVRISGDNVFVKTQSGFMDIEKLTPVQLEKLLEFPSYGLAHEAIKAILANGVKSADDEFTAEEIEASMKGE